MIRRGSRSLFSSGGGNKPSKTRNGGGDLFPFAANGTPSGDIAVFLINDHGVNNVSDAEAYIARLQEVERVMNEVSADLIQRTDKGVTTPRMVFAPAIANGVR